jgi:hypothetical protein
MAFRLRDHIIAAQLSNFSHYTVHGVLVLRGLESPVMVELTGNPAEDLRGRSIKIEIPANDYPATEEDLRAIKGFHGQQIGPTGEMTAARKVKTFDCSVEEFLSRSEQGDAPPITWKQGLYLEWFSQNGRVVIELEEPNFRVFTKEELDAEDAAEPADAELLAEAEEIVEEATGGLKSEDDPFDSDPFSSSDEEQAFNHVVEDHPEAHETELSFRLVPEELEREMERSSKRIDREISGQSEDSIKFTEEMELMDDAMERGNGTPIKKLFRELELPAPNAELTENDAEQALKTALARLALSGIAFHPCKHCTPNEAYRLLVEEIGENATYHPEVCGTGWVIHHCAWEHCKKCAEEMDL